MQFEGPLPTAVRAALTDPRLLVWSALVAFVDAASVVGLVFLVSGQGVPVILTLVLAQRLLVAALLAVTLPGSYALYRAGADPALDGRFRRAIPRHIGRAIRAATPRLLASSLLARAIALLAAVAVAVVVGAAFLGVDTVGIWAAAHLPVPVDRGILALTAVLVTVTAAAWLANGALAYHDLLVVDGESSPRHAWRESAAATTADPLRLVGQSLLRGLLLSAPWIAGIATVIGLAAVTMPPGAGPPPAPIVVAGGLVFLVVAAICRATVVAYHVDHFEVRVRDRVAGGTPAARPHPILDRPRRVAVAALVVFAAVAGVAMVRTADIAPGPEVPDAAIQPDDADATVAVAVERTMERDFAFAFDQESHNASADSWRTVIDGGGRIDADGKETRYWTSLHLEDGEAIRQDVYGADGIVAVSPASGRIRTNNVLEITHRTGNWSAAIGRSFDATAGSLDVLPTDAVDWERVASDGETVTYATTDVAQLHDVTLSITPPDPANEHVEYLNDTGARIVIDRETATVRRYSARVHFRETYDPDDPRVVRQRATLSITDVGDVAVGRPAGLAGPGPLEVLWDVVFYA